MNAPFVSFDNLDSDPTRRVIKISSETSLSLCLLDHTVERLASNGGVQAKVI